LALSLLVAGCSGGPAGEQAATDLAENDAQRSMLNAFVEHDNWVSAIHEEPSTFADLAGKQRPALIALHKGDLTGALDTDGLSDSLRHRTEAELARLHYRLARISRFTWAAILSEYKTRTGKDAPPKVQNFARLAEHSGWWGPSPSSTALPTEMQAVQADLETATAIELIALAQKPIDTLENKVRLYNPLSHQALLRAYQSNLPETPEAELSSLIFSGCATSTRPNTGSETHPYFCIDGGLLKAAGFESNNPSPTLSAEDDRQAARDFVGNVYAAVMEWTKKSLSSPENPEGSALILDLQLSAIYRTQSLLLLCEYLLDADRPHQAIAVALLSQDLAAPKQINHLNSPIVFAILAEAKLRTGHARAALDYLEVLVADFPEVTGLDETVGDLVVLQNLNRLGDSKEL